jgi:hypothetical protein
MFPLIREDGPLFGLEQGPGVYRLHARAVGQFLIAAVGCPGLEGFKVQIPGGVGKDKGIIGSGPDNPFNLITAYHITVTLEHILLGTGVKVKPFGFGKGGKGAGAVQRAGKNMNVGGHGFKGRHNRLNQGL